MSNSFLVELGMGALLPWVLLFFNGIRTSPGGLFTACSLVVGGVILNRINVFMVGFTPPLSSEPYFPAVGEICVTLGLIACLMFLYRVAVTFLPILPKEELR